MINVAKKIKDTKQERTINAEIREINTDERTVELSFSSEEPYTRWGWTEILSHKEGEIRLERLNDVGSVLFSHGYDPNYGRMPIAAIEKVWIDETEGKAKAVVSFDDDPDSDRVFKKVAKKLIKGISVGYVVHKYEDVLEGKKSKDGKFDGPASIARDWEPIEISFVATPADPTVGVGREEQGRDNEKRSETDDQASVEINENRKWFNALRKKILNS